MITPRQDGYYMLAESHPHSACWMAWPSSKKTYAEAPEGRDIAFEKAKMAYSKVANAIAGFEPVNMLSNKADVADVKRLCSSSIHVIEVETDDGWLRDSGPTFVINKKKELAGIDWVFNGWGNKCAHEKDARVTAEVLHWQVSGDLPVLWYWKAAVFM